MNIESIDINIKDRKGVLQALRIEKKHLNNGLILELEELFERHKEL